MIGAARKPRTRDPLQRARALAGQLGGEWVDPWTLGDRILQESEERGLAMARVGREVVSEALWRRAVAGDHGAQRRLLAVWHSEVHRWCRAVAGRHVEADGLAHEVLVHALRRLAHVQRPARFGTWLGRVLLRQVRRQERRARIRRFLPERIVLQRPAAVPLADAVVLTRGRDARIRLALDCLPAEQRVLWWAHLVEGHRLQELCAWAGLDEGTVVRRLAQGRTALAQACDRLGVGPTPAPHRAAPRPEPSVDALALHERRVWRAIRAPTRPRRTRWCLAVAALAISLGGGLAWSTQRPSPPATNQPISPQTP